MPNSPEDRAGYDPPTRLRELPSWLTNELARKASALVSEALAQEGARRQHFSLLTALAESGPASQADLGRRLAIDRSDLHALVNELEGSGYVARVRDEHDRRRNVVSVTQPGRAALARLDKRVDEAQKALLAPLSAADRRTLRRLLTELVDGVN